MFPYILFAGRMMNQALIFPKPTNQITHHLHLHKLFSSKVTLTKIAQDLELSEEGNAPICPCDTLHSSG